MVLLWCYHGVTMATPWCYWRSVLRWCYHGFIVCRVPDPAFFETPVSADSALQPPVPGWAWDAPVVRPTCVSAILLPVGKGVEQWEEFGQCLCMDWFPGNKKCKVAAGFSNGALTHRNIRYMSIYGIATGVVCVWDLKTRLFRSSFLHSSMMTFHPLVHVTAHQHPCRCVSWCPHDDNYLFTGLASPDWCRVCVSACVCFRGYGQAGQFVGY